MAKDFLALLSFHVPQHTMQLISGGQVVDSGCQVIFDFDASFVLDRHTGAVLGAGPRCHNSQGLWELDWLHFPSVATTASLSTSIASSLCLCCLVYQIFSRVATSPWVTCDISSLVRRDLLGSVSDDVSNAWPSFLVLMARHCLSIL